MRFNLWFYTMEHRGGLKEAVATVKEISIEEFEDLQPYYKYYCYDERIHSERYIYNWPEKSAGVPMWLLCSRVPSDKWRL